MKKKSMSLKGIKSVFLPTFLMMSVVIIYSCTNATNNNVSTSGGSSDSLTEEQTHSAANALKGLVSFEGLEVNTVATEPMLKNPTNIDVDDRGRVWVTEAYNYRPAINGNPTNEKGDRIMILEDTNGDGVADTGKVFYQGPELNAPLGICVLGNKVIVSQSPFIWVFYDDNGDDKADRKEILFQGIGGEQHDHGAHAVTFGPDGKLYFNLGNEGKTIKDKNGKPIFDTDGDEIGPKKYKQGMVLRCDTNGTNLEVLADNFRNPYEVAVDSYGTLWQSDNDDDGNRGVRINYVMEYGHYGYTDEMTGASWQQNRTNLEDSIPLRHWHLNDPGTVPNLLQTFAGSPTGMVVYEGALLPDEFRNQLIHTDAGPNVVRSYPVKKNGAGYTASIINILKGEKDQWFRPADVCVAPDGSLIVADWYDPGVGGHQAGDQTRGRIYRVAPAGSKYNIPKQDYTTTLGAVTALQSPNLAVRYKGWTALQAMGEKAIPELENVWNTSANPRMKARAFWALVKMPKANTSKYIQEAIKQSDPDLRIVAIRAARELHSDVIAVIRQLADDTDPQVRRECEIALHHNKSPEAADVWAAFAAKHDDKDRWDLEALGIGADGQWGKFFAAYTGRVKDPVQTAASRDIVWRARTDSAIPYIAQLAAQPDVAIHDRLRYFRAFDFNQGALKSKFLLAMLEKNTTHDTAINKLVLHHLDNKTVQQSKMAQTVLAELLKAEYGTEEYLELVNQYELKSQNQQLLDLSIAKSDESMGRNAARLLLQSGGAPLAWKVINGNDSLAKKSLLTSLSRVGSKEAIDMLQDITLSAKYPMATRKLAAARLGNSGSAEDLVLTLLKNKKVPADLLPDVVASVQGAWRKSVSAEAASYLPNAGKKTETAKKAPVMADLTALKGDVLDGKAVYARTCAVCHQVNKEGLDFGPNLSEIGSKYPKEGLLKSIVYPSEGISFNYEGSELKMKDGSTLTGIIASKTETDLVLKYPGGTKQNIKTSDVKSMKELKLSMMPENLYSGMSNQELANLLEFLSSLKKK